MFSHGAEMREALLAVSHSILLISRRLSDPAGVATNFSVVSKSAPLLHFRDPLSGENGQFRPFRF